MASLVLSNRSGGDIVLSGIVYSGGIRMPRAGIQLRLDPSASGNAYIGLSGGLTITSGAMSTSGGCLSGMLDGMILLPGDAYFMPAVGFPASGSFNLYALADNACSGQARLWLEVF